MIVVHGYLGKPSEELRADIDEAVLVVGGRRHLEGANVPEHKRVVLGKLDPAIGALRHLNKNQLAVVIASGDPLFYGIGRTLRREGLEFRVVTSPTSIAVAFATVALPWDDAKIVSAHANDVDAAIEVCQYHHKVAVLTTKEKGIVQLATALPDKWFVLAERLGEDNQRVRTLTAGDAAALDPDDVLQPNVVLVLDDPPESLQESISTTVAGEPRQKNNEPVIGQLVNSPASKRNADAIDAGLKVTSLRFEGSAKENLPKAWTSCDLIISHLALGATTRLIAPYLASKKTDPGVVVVDEAARFAVPLVGGHVGGANDLARKVSDVLGGTAVLTTATDAINLPALDTLGWGYAGDVAGVTQAIINEHPVLVERRQPWPLPPLPAYVSDDAVDPVARIVVTDEVAEPYLVESIPTVVLHPKSLVIGMGCNSGTSFDHLVEHVDKTLADAGLSIDSVAALVTHEVKAGELGLIQLANKLGVELETFPADVLAKQAAPTTSTVVSAHVGTPSVSEAAVLAKRAELIVKKTKTSDATCAVGRLPARGKLSVVGIGPGARDLLTPRAVTALRECTLLIGYGPYVKQVRDVVRVGCEISPRKMGTEAQRTSEAIERARSGENVVLVCSGDPSTYAMASPVLEQGTEGIDVQIVPGVTASLAVSSILGAPLGHDYAHISLSDLHTDWESIEQRLHGAAEGDFVVALYNPRSKKRVAHLPRALEILGKHRPPTTPVAVVHNATRPHQTVITSTLAEFQPEWVNMNSLVVVGSSRTKYVSTGSGEELIVTPRDYKWMPNDEPK